MRSSLNCKAPYFLPKHVPANIYQMAKCLLIPSFCSLQFCRICCQHLITHVYSSHAFIISINGFWNIYFLFLLSTFTSPFPLWKVLRITTTSLLSFHFRNIVDLSSLHTTGFSPFFFSVLLHSLRKTYSVLFYYYCYSIIKWKTHFCTGLESIHIYCVALNKNSSQKVWTALLVYSKFSLPLSSGTLPQ